MYIFKTAKDNHFHFNYEMPLLSFPLNGLFLFGLGYLFFSWLKTKSRIPLFILFCIFIFPITNQVIIGEIGQNHRLMNIMPIICLVAAYGLAQIKRRALLNIFLVIITATSLFSYFFGRLSDYRFENTGSKEYVFQQILDYIRKDTSGESYLILNDDFFRFRHYEEKIEFLTYPKSVKWVEKDDFIKQIELGIADNSGKRTKYILLRKIAELGKYNHLSDSINLTS